jgi:putative membrane protein
MTMQGGTSLEKNTTTAQRGHSDRLVWVVSGLLLAVVAFLYLGPDLFSLGLQRGALPAINGVINALTTVVLIAAWRAIMRKRITLHKRLMLTAVVLSAVFLVFYVVQHSSFESAQYGGPVRGIYLFILLTHIVLAAVITPLVLITLNRALGERFDKHRRIARVTLPLWLYVSITGVVVYLMMMPYY